VDVRAGNGAVIQRAYNEPERQRLRGVLLKGGEMFAANKPDIPLVHAGKAKAERKRICLLDGQAEALTQKASRWA
jgi:hypothetical protein